MSNNYRQHSTEQRQTFNDVRALPELLLAVCQDWLGGSAVGRLLSTQ